MSKYLCHIYSSLIMVCSVISVPDGAKCCLNSASTDWLIHWLVYAYCWYVNYKGYLPSNEILGWLWMNCTWWDGRAIMIVLQMILTHGKTDRNKEKPVRQTKWSVATPWNTLIEYVIFIMWSYLNCPHSKWLGITLTFYTCMWEMCFLNLSQAVNFSEVLFGF